MKQFPAILIAFCLLFTASQANANDERVSQFKTCLADAVISSAEEETLKQIKAKCRPANSAETDILETRYLLEQSAADNPFVILPHRPNFVLPISISSRRNPIYNTGTGIGELDDVEAQFQISLKYLAVENFLSRRLNLSFAFTTQSWWQAYNEDISAPFRETVYEPELILSYTRPWEVMGVPIRHAYISLNHQSNGKSGLLSRSWNRIITGLTFNKKRIVWRIEGWWRIPEEEKETPTSAKGDDNPDIHKFLGYGQLSGLIKLDDDQSFEIALRNNLRSENRGSVEMGWSYPFTKRLRGYVQYFNGYGDGLINYNVHNYRLGIGVKISDWL